MSTVKISELPVLTTADAADEFFVVDDSAGVTKKITQAGLADFGSNTLNAAGINFGANTLDDYEEGTWTPTFNGTSSSNTGFYIKVGNVVHFWSRLSVSSSSGTNDALFGLPFTVTAAAGGQNNRGIGNTTWNNALSRQLGLLVKTGLPDDEFYITDGQQRLSLNDVDGRTFWTSGSFSVA